VGVWETTVVLAVVAMVLFLFLREVLPVALTAMLAAALLMIIPNSTGGAILTPEQGLSGFASQATIAVMAMFVLSAGVERTGIVERLAQYLSKFAGKDSRRQALSLGGVAGPLSGFINNTPIVALLIPVATKMAHDTGKSPSKLLMPLSFFAMLGGTLTIIGTSTNLLGNALLPTYGMEPFAFFSFTLVGVIALAVAALYFLTIGMRLLPDRGIGDAVSRFDLKGFMAEFEIPGDSPAVGQSIRDLELVRGQGVQVLRIVRDQKVIPAPVRATLLAHGDLIVIQASRERLETLPEAIGVRPLAELKHGLDDADGETSTAELVVAPGSRLEGKTLRQLAFRDRHDALVLAIRHRGRVAIGPLSRTRLTGGDVLLVEARKEALDRLEQSSLFFMARERPTSSFRPEKLPFALGILAAVVATSAFGIFPIVVAALAGAVLMVITGCLRLEEFLESIRWDIILLLAGVIPLGVALQTSGAAALLASGLTNVGGLMPPLAFLMLIFIATSVVTEMVSNNASVVLLIPVVVAAALALDLDPRPFALAVMLAASTSMLTPIGYQTNTMVYAPGMYRFADFLRVGGPLNLILAIVMPLTIAWLFPLQ
jgi:di/tricarboxylate transporter